MIFRTDPAEGYRIRLPERRSSVVALLGALILLAGVPERQALAQESSVPPARTVVETFLDAFNAHDVSGMLSLVADSVELYYADEHGVFTLESNSARRLGADMDQYFDEYPDVRSVAESYLEGPAFVAFRERIVGGQSSLAVYEVRDGLIRRVWYYPAE